MAQELFAEPADLLGEGRGEEQGLPCLREHREDALDVGQEPHVEHAVRLVEDEDLHLREIHRLLLEVIEKSAGRRDEDLDAAVQRLFLRGDIDAAVDHRRAQREMLAVDAHTLRHLRRELARWREDEGAHRMTRRRRARIRMGRQELEQWQGEAGGFAGSCLGATHEVAPLEDHGDRLRLDRGRVGITLIGDCAQQLRHKLQRSERHPVKTREAVAGCAGTVTVEANPAKAGVGVGIKAVDKTGASIARILPVRPVQGQKVSSFQESGIFRATERTRYAHEFAGARYRAG